MKPNKIFGILAIFLILAAVPSASAAVYMKTDKTTYNKGETVKFTLYNYNSHSIEIDKKPSVLTENGECVYGCYYVAVYDPVRIPAWGRYSWYWDQKNSNTGSQTSSGKYKGYLGEYYSNIFTIKDSTVGTTVTVRGYIRDGVEGGCKYLEGDDGNKYELLYSGTLPPVGSYVLVSGRIRNDMASVCMIGKILEVRSIFRLR